MSAMTATVRAVARSRLRVPVKAALTLTPTAVTRVSELLARKPEAIALKIGIQKKGCSGQAYTVDYASSKAPGDEEVLQNGARVLIGPNALFSILGSELDYVENPRDMSGGFVFNNPNIKGTCGCNESFSI
eukprot:Opistho-2@17829